MNSNKKNSYTWRKGPIWETTKLYAKHKLYKSLLYSLLFYPLPVLFKKSTKKTKKRKDEILTKELTKYLKKHYRINFQEIKGPFALVGLVEIYLMGLYDFFKPTKKDTVYDFGATVGEYALKCARKGATVVAVELEKEPYEALKKNIAINKLEEKVIPLNLRVGSKGASIDEIAKKTKTLPTIIKMDIEGDEVKAFKGAKKTLKKIKPHIIVETHSKKLEEECMEILKPLNYKIIKKIDMKAKNKETNLLFLTTK